MAVRVSHLNYSYKLKELANSTVVSKLEKLLPTMVTVDWSKKVMVERFNENSSEVKFDKLLQLLKLEKERVEYISSDANKHAGGDHPRGQTHVNYVMGFTMSAAKQGGGLRHPFKTAHKTQNCTVKKRKYKFCQSTSHHFLLCEQLNKSKSSAACADNQMLPLMRQAHYVFGAENNPTGTVMDLCSTDNYLTNSYSAKWKLPGQPVKQIVWEELHRSLL